MSEDVKLSEPEAEELPAGISIFDICETDPTAEEDGRWIEDIFNDGTNIDVKMRRLTSKASMNVRRRLEKPYRKYMKRGELPEDVAIKLTVDQVVEAVILDWRGINDRDGKPIPYSKEAAKMLLTKLTEFRNVIIAHSMNMDNFRFERLEELEKN